MLDFNKLNPYERISADVICRFGITTKQRINMLPETDLGGRKPLHLPRHMKTSVGDSTIGETYLKEIWLQRLPSHIKGVCVSTTERLSSVV